MQGMSCLYRRSSGIYAVRLVVPKRLRESIGRTEIHTSTGVRSLAVAKTEALRIQLHWRKHFQAMDFRGYYQPGGHPDPDGIIGMP